MKKISILTILVLTSLMWVGVAVLLIITAINDEQHRVAALAFTCLSIFVGGCQYKMLYEDIKHIL